MAIFLTGDTHGDTDIHKLSVKRWPEGIQLTKNDYLIILGDFGLVWDNTPQPSEIYWTWWLSNKPWTTLFVCGNHENHPRLYALEQVDMFGSKVGKVSDSIFHLKRGHIYTIEDKKFFVMGGAQSIDKPYRTEGKSWWPEEIPSWSEMDFGLQNLEQNQYSVDYIIAHTAPSSIARMYLESLGLRTDYNEKRDPTEKYLEHVCQSTQFKDFYCGHWHENKDFGKYHMLYENIVRLP